MTPEQKARQQIDRQLVQAGWIVQDYAQMHITAGLGVAVREFPLKTGFADYLLYAHAKAIGSVEAKPEGFGLMGVAEQSTKYSIGLPKSLPNWEVPLPFAYESTGTECRFTNRKEADARSRLVFTFEKTRGLSPRFVSADRFFGCLSLTSSLPFSILLKSVKSMPDS